MMYDYPNSTGNTTQQSDHCNIPTQTDFILQTAFLILILLLTLIGNVLVILAVIFFRRLRSITNYFVVSLAVSDLLIAVISLPFRIDQTLHNAKWCLSKEACITWIITDTTCSFASMWNLAIISIDRYIAIVHPFRYHSLMTARVGYGLIGFVWGLSSFLSLLVFINWTDFGQESISIHKECTKADKIYYTFTSGISFFLPLLIVIFMYVQVFKVALNQARAMAALTIASDKRGRRSSINLVREVKAAKTLAVVISCFVICWFPFSVLILISLWNRKLFDPLSDDVMIGLSLTFVYLFPAVNSTLNPIIYALFNRDFRYAFLKLVKRITGQRLGAVGFGEATITGLNTANGNGNRNHQTNAVRFNEQEPSESSEAGLPTIPMRDPNAFFNDGCENSPNASESVLTAPHDANSMETTLDEDGQKHSATFDRCRNNVEAAQADGSISRDVPSGDSDSKQGLPQKLPPLERNVSKSAEEDDVDCGTGKFAKPLALPPIESATSNDLQPSPTGTKSEHSDSSVSSLVNFSTSGKTGEDKRNDITDNTC